MLVDFDNIAKVYGYLTDEGYLNVQEQLEKAENIFEGKTDYSGATRICIFLEDKESHVPRLLIKKEEDTWQLDDLVYVHGIRNRFDSPVNIRLIQKVALEGFVMGLNMPSYLADIYTNTYLMLEDLTGYSYDFNHAEGCYDKEFFQDRFGFAIAKGNVVNSNPVPLYTNKREFGVRSADPKNLKWYVMLNSKLIEEELIEQRKTVYREMFKDPIFL